MRWVLLTLAVALLGGCLNTFEEPEPPPEPHFVRIVGVDVSPARVLSQAVVMNVSTTLDNRGGGASDELRVEVKAYSEERGFLLAENATRVGVVPGDTTREVPIEVQVPREGGVRFEVVLYEAELGKERASVTARNLASLEPEVLDTGLRVSGVDFLVLDLSNGSGTQRAQIRTDLYVTNEGDTASEDLMVQVKAREAQTSLVADVAWVGTGSIAPGSTAIRSLNLTVPDDHNYVFEILTWRGDVIVARSEGRVQLAPTFVKSNDTEIVTTDTRVSDFVIPGTTMPTAAAPTWGGPGFAGGGPTPTPRVPGPALGAIVVALAAAALVLRRRSP